jgi:phage protein D
VTRLDPIIRLAWESAAVRNAAQPFSLDLRERVLSFEFVDKARGADTAKLTLDNSDLSLFDSEAMQAGNKLRVQWGYPFALYPVQVVTVKKVKGFRKLTIEGTAEESSRLLREQKTRTWVEATEFEVAEEIAREMGFVDERSRQIERGEIEVARRGITQSGETDMGLLLRLARHIGATFYISSGVFHFHEPREGRPPLKTVTYFTDQEGTILGDPEIEHDVRGRPGRVVRRGRSPRERATTEGAASNREDTTRPILGDVLPCPDPSEVTWDDIERGLLEQGIDVELQQSIPPEQPEAQSDVSPTTAESDGEATSQARQRYRGGQRSAVKLSLTLVGDVEVRADNTLRVDGIGEKYSGNYYIEETTHSLAPGKYTTKVKLKRNATSRSRGGGRSRRRSTDGGTTAVPAGADLPFSSEFGTWDCQGNFNIEEPPSADTEALREYDADGTTRVRYSPRTGLGVSTPGDPWEEDW